MKKKHSCVEKLLEKNILYKLAPDEEDLNPKWFIKNTTPQMSVPRTLYFLILDEEEIREFVED